MNPIPTVSQPPEFNAPADWHTVDFISDLHLHASEPATFNAWQHYMQSTPADAVFILGDLFEAWVGDDAINADLQSPLLSFEDECCKVLGDAAGRLAVFFMHGNRDFLVGTALTDLCNTTLLDDPTVLVFNQHRWLLSHGDALCLDDTAYMRFRQQVRSAAWQSAFLEKPLAERQEIARGLRAQSEALKKTTVTHADLDTPATRAWLQAAQAKTLIHGHTHKPAVHDLGGGFNRVVLSDWDLQASPPRAEVLRLSSAGLQRLSMA